MLMHPHYGSNPGEPPIPPILPIFKQLIGQKYVENVLNFGAF